jgi:hypothetical protein
MARMKVEQPKVFQALCHAATIKVEDCNARNGANTLRAMATMKVEHPEVFQALGHSV